MKRKGKRSKMSRKLTKRSGSKPWKTQRRGCRNSWRTTRRPKPSLKKREENSEKRRKPNRKKS